jgi:hypothetical protein
MLRSQFNLFREIGKRLFANSADALRFAMDRIAMRPPKSVPELAKPASQMWLLRDNVVGP